MQVGDHINMISGNGGVSPRPNADVRTLGISRRQNTKLAILRTLGNAKGITMKSRFAQMRYRIVVGNSQEDYLTRLLGVKSSFSKPAGDARVELRMRGELPDAKMGRTGGRSGGRYVQRAAIERESRSQGHWIWKGTANDKW